MKTNLLKPSLLAVALLGALQGFAQVGNFGDYFIHNATASNISNNYTIMTRPSLDGNSGAKLIITQNWGSSGTYADYKTGVWYNGANWSIYNENSGTGAFADGSNWNVLVPSTNGTTFSHTSATANISGNYTIISDPSLDGNPNAIFFITHNWGSSGVYNDHNTGVWYTGTNWAIYNEDMAAFPEGAVYDIFVPTSGNANVFTHTTATANISGNYTIIDNALTNGQDSRVLFVTHNWGGSGVYNDNPIGVWYTGTNWSIFNQNIVAMPEGVVFNVMLGDGTTGVDEQANNANYINVFPNPVNDNVTVGYVLKDQSNVELSIINLMGQEVKAVYTGNQQPGNFTLNTNTSDLAPGIYSYLLNVNGNVSRKMFVKS